MKSVLRFPLSYVAIFTSAALFAVEGHTLSSNIHIKQTINNHDTIKHISSMEPFVDLNNNGFWDSSEPFIDEVNGFYDIGELFIDINNNNIYDSELWYVDSNNNGKWDSGDSYIDLNGDGKKNYQEEYTDDNNNKKYDPPERVDNYKFTFNAKKTSEFFEDSKNGQYDLGESFEDINNDGIWTKAEFFEDINNDGIWSKLEIKSKIEPDSSLSFNEIIELDTVTRKIIEPDSSLSLNEKVELDNIILDISPQVTVQKNTIEIQNSKITLNKNYYFNDYKNEWKYINYYELLPKLIDPFPPKIKILSLKSTHPFWNGHFLNPIKKLRKIKINDEVGLNHGTIVMYHRYESRDLQIPAIINISWYRDMAMIDNKKHEIQKYFIKKLTQKSKRKSGSSKGINLINTKIGETDVELNISGNIGVEGALVFEEKDLVTTNLKESKSWDLEIEQTQRFTIDGNIGDRFFVKIKQDSEADFTWENDLTIEYKGEKNDILQKAEAGNISLNLEGMDAVNLGGANSTLFGIKAVHQFGPLEMQSVIAREQVKKSEKTMDGGSQTGAPQKINDYNFIKDRYFFIDNKFKQNFYPLNESNNHIYDPSYVISEFEIYQKVNTPENPSLIQATAFLDPKDLSSYNVGGTWVKLEENTDYEIDRILGYLRLNSTQNAIAIAYTTTTFDANLQEFGAQQDTTNGTSFKEVYDSCVDINIDNNYQDECRGLINLKLLKDINSSTPNSPTWPLMFKNVYSLGGSNIDPNGLEVEIVRDLGGGDERTHSESGKSFINIFGLDSEDANFQDVDGGDGKIDLYGSILNLSYGELILPTYLPFAYDNNPRVDLMGNPIIEGIDSYWGSNSIDLSDILEVHLKDSNGNFVDEDDDGPAMYFDTNQDDINAEHEFIIKVKTASRSSSMSLGFMIVEGSETVRLGSNTLQKDVDYTIDYFSGTINFINPAALDPTAEISVSYEENEFISFDQKLLVGSHLKYALDNKNYLAGGMFYYNQSIADEKVDIGYEPMRNFVWNVKGKYQNELDFITRSIDLLPLIETTKPSVFSIEGNYAEINPNPNPLGQAFIDDFESAKRTSSFSIMMRQWKVSSPPQNSIHTIFNRGKMNWYNPYEDELTKNIWPEQSTSTRANNNTTKTLHLETSFEGAYENSTFWNGIMIPLYASEYDQSLTKYLDIWLNAESVEDDSFKLHIDIGHISEDWNSNNNLDTEDEPVYGPGMGDGILSDGEDIGVDNCTDKYEDGWGGCLCNNYDLKRFGSNLNDIYKDPDQFCLDPDPISYNDVLLLMDSFSDTIKVNLNVDENDPNGDNWCYNTTGCNSTSNYSQANGTEGNGQAMGYRYPDSEDLNKNNTLDTLNNYFTTTILPKIPVELPESMVVTATESDGIPTGWKLIRIPLSGFTQIGNPKWNDVPSFRLRLESTISTNQNLKIAKIELVENDWREMGIVSSSYDEIIQDPYFSVSVINTDESTEYKKSLDNINIILEHDEYNDVDMKEQALVISFDSNPDYTLGEPDSSKGGIGSGNTALIKNTFPSLGNNASSYFAYEKMEMFVHGGDPEDNLSCDWCSSDTSNINLLFRIGKDDKNYYEIHQPIYSGWDEKNHININIDNLTQLKIPTIEYPAEELNDIGLDNFENDFENGCIGDIYTPFGSGFSIYKYTQILDSLNFDQDSSFYKEQFIISTNILNSTSDTLFICGQEWWNEQNCSSCSRLDPNGDNFDSNLNLGGTENNLKYDQLDFNNDGIILSGEAEPAIEDYNNDNIYTPHPSFDYTNNYYFWNINNDIENVCGNCSELQVKGNPSINNIQTIVMGITNNSEERIFGKVLVNELRMTGVKKSKGRSYSLNGSISFADLFSLSGNYNKKDSDFHKLQQRLGTGSSDESFSTTIKFHPNIILPARLGIKTPMTFGYTNSISTPKYHPGSDIITDPNNNNFDIEELQTLTEKISFSTSFNKSSRSSNWFVKRTIDNISFNFSAIQTNKSNNQILKELKNNYEASSSYSYTFGKENYISPFEFLKDWIILGNILGEARYYYTPDKMSANIQFNENFSEKIQRVSITDTTNSYSFNMGRKFTLNHKFTKTLSSNYSKQIDSNYPEEKFRYNKIRIIEDLNPGVIKNINEKITNTYAPDFLNWLSPTITYNPNYNWSLNIIDSSSTTANIKSSSTFKTKIGLNIKDVIELIYTPDNKSKSSSSRSRGRGRSRSSANKNKNKINIKNPIFRFVLGGIHSTASKFNKISGTYTYTSGNDYNNFSSDLNPSYLYRLGIQESPADKKLFNEELLTNNNIVGSSSKKYENDINFSTSISITRAIVTSLDFRYKNSLILPSTASKTKNESFSFYPLGLRGDEGMPISNWSINWSGIEKWWFLDNIFKSISLQHGFNGEKSLSSKDVNNDGIISSDELQNEQYTFNYSPIIGITTKSKGRSPVSFKINYNVNQNIKKIDVSTERNHSSLISSSISFKKSGGLTIPVFFFRDFFIPNDLDFSLNFNWSKDQKLMTTTEAENLSDFNEQTNNSSWTIKPNISYSFTRWVNGNFFFIYGISENKTTGKSIERDFGFNVNIKIQG